MDAQNHSTLYNASIETLTVTFLGLLCKIVFKVLQTVLQQTYSYTPDLSHAKACSVSQGHLDPIVIT